MGKYLLGVGFALILLALSGCSANPEVQVVEINKDTVVYEEIIRINNCGGKGESEQTATREFATSVEFGAEVSAGYQSVVRGTLSAKYSEYRNTSKSQRLVAPPGTNMEFVLLWSDDVRAGNVQVNGKSGTYEVRIPISVEQVSSRDLGCGIMTAPPPPSATQVASATEVTEAIPPASQETYIPTPTSTRLPPTPHPYVKEYETIPSRVTRRVSLGAGELLVGTAVRFAVRAYNYSTMEINGSPPYTVFLIRGPIEVDVEIENGGWDYWVNVYDENFAMSLLQSKREEVAQHWNYASVGHLEVIIPPP